MVVPFALFGTRPQAWREFQRFLFITGHRSDQYLRDIQNAGFEAGLYTDQLNYNRYRGTAQKYSVNYHPPVGRGLDNQLDVFGALRILYKTAFCRDMPWMFKPRFWYYTEDLNMRMRKSVNMDEVDLSLSLYRG